MATSGAISVWEIDPETEEWTLLHQSAELAECRTWIERCEAEGRSVALYEGGSFQHKGKTFSGQVGFRWTSALNDYMQGAPKGRGQGWTEDFDTHVSYVPTGGAIVPVDPEAPWGHPAEQDEPRHVERVEPRYAEEACEHCGIMLPLKDLHRYTRDVKVGKTSGSSRTYRSSSHRSGKKSTSHTYGSGSSYSSGRTHYRTETSLLCDPCYQQQYGKDRLQNAGSTALNILARLFNG